MANGKIASIKLTCYNKDVYEPSDVSHQVQIIDSRLHICFYHSGSYFALQDSFLLVDALLELSTRWQKGWPRM
jgi:hypothetical protein